MIEDARGYIDEQVEQGRKTVEKTVQSLTEQAFDQMDQGKRKISKMVGV
jgi:hypothetical protein